MASSMGMACGSWIQGGYLKGKRRNIGRVCCSSASLTDQYRTLRIQPGASEKEVKKAFRQLALQYHPDVCKGNNCGVQFHRINEAYDMVMTNLRESNSDESYDQYSEDSYDDSMRGMHDPSWDLWEEWMGWEGAGIRDYTSHINPYI
ncbi:chaperone protein dnaJ 8, chloroplastic [Cinnamomum micranthum f. kanehirae]|uniref:Chaperone protein dnaJ 8, chloroplastic n=1 Tax=Cinnamomum micranthum f. kanehirae TaxID=337451 RepID=A0A3S3NFI4_9MAGN|nr:chaperone protein dnaJ 8, chloroplastic [Cinnamomum micranthum f. kanehirae]